MSYVLRERKSAAVSGTVTLEECAESRRLLSVGKLLIKTYLETAEFKNGVVVSLLRLTSPRPE